MPWLFFFPPCPFPRFTPSGCFPSGSISLPRISGGSAWSIGWLQDFLELFTTVMVAYIFVLLGVVHQRVALRLIYLDVVLYSAGGVIGTMHHLYFSGEPAVHMALGALRAAGGDSADVPHTGGLELSPAWRAAKFEGAHAVSAFLGGDVSGVGRVLEFPGRGHLRFSHLIRRSSPTMHQIGTALTANHGHAAMMGVDEMVAVGLALSACAIWFLAETVERPRGEGEFLVAQPLGWRGWCSPRCSRWGCSSSITR